MKRHLSYDLEGTLNSRENNKTIDVRDKNLCTEESELIPKNIDALVYNIILEKPFMEYSNVELKRVRSTMTDMVNNKRTIDNTWDFSGENAKVSIHGIHTYPAMMIPQITKRLIENYGKDSKLNFDPFCGSGTSLVESLLHNMNSYGNDINPLAILISKVKTTPINPNDLNKIEKMLIQKLRWESFNAHSSDTPNYSNIEFWFKPKVIKDLVIIKQLLLDIEDTNIRDFFLVCFSETVRKVSNTRGGEYKLYRLAEDKLNQWNPDTISTFLTTVHDNISFMHEYFTTINNEKMKNGLLWSKVLLEDMREKISVPENSIDFIVTSPPYGDSRTTVAYGQFSRLALQWLDYDYDIIKNIDRNCLGGIRPKSISDKLTSPTLYEILEKITAKDAKRALDVFSFYNDFDKTINEIERVTKEGSIICMVVGNRNVKQEVIPTDVIFAQLFEARGFNHLETIVRNIPTKRLPKKSSPTNVKGKSVSTMNEEYIIIMKK